MELNAQNLHVCCLGVAEVAQNKRMNPRLLSGYLFAHNLAFAIVR
jgi:hypothetical protein